MATGIQRIFVGGLTSNTSEEEVEARLGRFGQLSDVKLVKKDSVKGKLEHCFAHLNFHGDAEQLKKLISTFNETRWKGNTLKIAKAKPDFLQQLAKERTVQPEAKPATMPQRRSGDQLLENFQKAGVENFTMKRAVPGTAIAGEKNWVVGKYGRVLPVMYLRTKDKRKVSKYDPSKYIHHLKQIRENTKHSTRDISSLTWSAHDRMGTHRSINGNWGIREQKGKRKGEVGDKRPSLMAKNRHDDHSVSSGDSSAGSAGKNAKRRCIRPGEARSHRVDSYMDGHSQGGRDDVEMESDRDSADTDEIRQTKNTRKGSLVSGMDINHEVPEVRTSKPKLVLDARTNSGVTGQLDLGNKPRQKTSNDGEIVDETSKQQLNTAKRHSFKFFERSSVATTSIESTESSDSRQLTDSTETRGTGGRMRRMSSGGSPERESSGDDTRNRSQDCSEIEKLRKVSFNESVVLHQEEKTVIGNLKPGVTNEESEIDVDAILNAEKHQCDSPDDVIASIVREMKMKEVTPAIDRTSSVDVEPVDQLNTANKDEASCGELVRTETNEEKEKEEKRDVGAKDEETGMLLKQTLISLSERENPRSTDPSSDSEAETLDSNVSADVDDAEEAPMAGNVRRSSDVVSKQTQLAGAEQKGHECIVASESRLISGSHSNKFLKGGTEFELLILDRSVHVKHGQSDVQEESHGSLSGGGSDSNSSGPEELSDDISSSDSEDGRRIVVEEFKGMNHYRDEYRGMKGTVSGLTQKLSRTKEGKRTIMEHSQEANSSDDDNDGANATGAVCKDKSESAQSRNYSRNKDFELLVLDKGILAKQANPDTSDESNETAENEGEQEIISGSSQESEESSDDSGEDAKIVVQEFKGMTHFRSHLKGTVESKPGWKPGTGANGNGREVKRKSSDSSESEVEESSNASESDGQTDAKKVISNESDSSGESDEDSFNASGTGEQQINQITQVHNKSIADGKANKDEKQKQVESSSSSSSGDPELDKVSEKIRYVENRTQKQADVHREDGEIFGFHDNKYSENADFEMLVLDRGLISRSSPGEKDLGGVSQEEQSLPIAKGDGESSSSTCSEDSDDDDGEDTSGSTEGGEIKIQGFKGMHNLRNTLKAGESSRSKPSPSPDPDSSDSESDFEDKVDADEGRVSSNSQAKSKSLYQGSDVMETKKDQGTGMEIKEVGNAAERDADDETSSTETSDDMSTRVKKKNGKKRKSCKIRNGQELLPGETMDIDARTDSLLCDPSVILQDEDNLAKNRLDQPGKKDKPKRQKAKKEDSLKLANDKRLRAVKERRDEMKAKQEAIKRALSSVDSVQKSGDKKHMRFDSSSESSTDNGSEENHDKISESTNQKQSLLESGSDCSESSETHLRSKNKKETISLFNEDDNEDSASDLDRFKSKPQFEGERGAKLLRLQDTFGDDPRFNLDERFAEEDSDDGAGGGEDRGQTGRGTGDVRQPDEEEEDGAAGGDLESEKAQSLSILESVLGVMLPKKQGMVDEKKTKFRDVNQIKFDPSREDHSKFVLAPAQKTPKKKKKGTVNESTETPMPEVSKETFADFQPDLKTAFAQDQPVTFGFFSGEVEEEPTGEKLDEDVVAAPPPPVFGKQKLPWDSSESEEEEEEEADKATDPDRINPTEEPEQHPVATPTRSFFFRNSNDHRLKSGVGRFCRSEKDDVTNRWQETKTEMLIASTKRHQKAVRDSQRMSKKRGRPPKRRRIGKKS